MKTHDVSIENKYFEPVRQGLISLLIFKNKIFYDSEPGDYILISKGSYEVKAKISNVYIKAFRDITDKEAQQMGFLNKDFLKDELIKRFDLKPLWAFETGSNIDGELFFLVKLAVNDKEHYIMNNPVKVNLYSNEYNKEFYNPEYDAKPWE